MSLHKITHNFNNPIQKFNTDTLKQYFSTFFQLPPL